MAMPKEKTKRETDYLKKIYQIIGIPKIGKSTLVSQLGDAQNKILFFATEPGHKELEIYKWQKEVKDEAGVVAGLEDPTSWDDFRAAVVEMTKQTEFRCLAIDTADNLFKWCATTVKRKHNIDHESDLGYGKGYNLIAEEFYKPINYLTQKGYGVFFITHSATYDRELGNKKITYNDSTLPNTAKKIINGLCDYIFFIYADGDGRRLIRTKGVETVNAGDRSGRLDEIIPLDAVELKRQLSLLPTAQDSQNNVMSESKGNLFKKDKTEVKKETPNKEATL